MAREQKNLKKADYSAKVKVLVYIKKAGSSAMNFRFFVGLKRSPPETSVNFVKRPAFQTFWSGVLPFGVHFKNYRQNEAAAAYLPLQTGYQDPFQFVPEMSGRPAESLFGPL